MRCRRGLAGPSTGSAAVRTSPQDCPARRGGWPGRADVAPEDADVELGEVVAFYDEHDLWDSREG